MSSRTRLDSNRIFDGFFEIAQPKSFEELGYILQKFPESYKSKDFLPFVYPCEFKDSTVQLFSFVLTDIESKWLFGFCRHDPKTSTSLVFLGRLPWHELIFRVLNTVADIIRAGEPEDLKKFLHHLFNKDIVETERGVPFTVPINDKDSFHCSLPVIHALPRIHENRNITEYYNAVDTHNMISIFASMLNERRIVFKSQKLSRLSACVQAANILLYPMVWQHLFIPLLPKKFIANLGAPFPFIFGVPASTWEEADKAEMEDVVVLDLDTNELVSPFRDADSLPPEVAKFLKSQLKNQSAMLLDGFARTFLKALVQLIGGYRDALKFQQGQKITFVEEAFVESRHSSMQPFLRNMLQLQIFKQFVEERLEMLNSGQGFSDEFEFEACNYTPKTSTINEQYSHWMSSMKKQGTAFFKTVKNRTNPAMKTAARHVKETGKDMKSMCKELGTKIRKEVHGGHHSHTGRSHQSNSTFHRTRPLTVGNATTSTNLRKPRNASVGINRSNEYLPLNSTQEYATASSGDKNHKESYPLQSEMDLGDLIDVFSKQKTISSPPVDRTLKPEYHVEEAAAAPVFHRQHDTLTHQRSLPLSPTSTHPFPISSNFTNLPCPSMHRPFTPTNSLPLKPSTSFPNFTSNEKIEDPFEQRNKLQLGFQTANPFSTDPFGFSYQGSVTTRTTSLDSPITLLPVTFSLPPSATSHLLHLHNQHNGTGDLIRLDSSSPPSDQALSRDNSDDSIKFKIGLENPLYPYFTPTNSNAANTKIATNGLRESSISDVTNNASFLHSSNTRANSRFFNEDEVDLCREYGLHLPSHSSAPNAHHLFDSNFDSNPKGTPGAWETFE